MSILVRNDEMKELANLKSLIKKIIMVIWKVITFQYISYGDYLNVYELNNNYYIGSILIKVIVFILGIFSFYINIFWTSLVLSCITILFIYIWHIVSYSRFVIKECTVDKIDKDLYRLKHFKISIKYIIGIVTLILNIFCKLFLYLYHYPITQTNIFNFIFIILIFSSPCFFLYYRFIKNGKASTQLAGMLVSSVFGIITIFLLLLFASQLSAPNDQNTVILKYAFPVLLFAVRQLNTYYQSYLIISILVVLIIHVVLTVITPAYRLKKLKSAFKLMNIVVLIVGYFSFTYIPTVYNNYLEGQQEIREFITDEEKKRELNDDEKEFKTFLNEDISSFSENEANSALVLLLLPYSLSYLICMFIVDYMEDVNRNKLRNYRKELDNYLMDENSVIGYVLYAYDKYIIYEDDADLLDKYTNDIETIVKNIENC